MSIGSIVGLVAGKISDLLIQEANLLCGVENQVRSLQAELEMMDSFLGDMEVMDETGDQRSQIIIKQIRKLVYDAEDVIDSYILEPKFLPPENTVSFFKRYLLCLCISLYHTHQVGSDIEAIKVRITETMDRWKNYRGENGVATMDVQAVLNRDIQRRQYAYSQDDELHVVVGLEEDTNKLVGLLTTNGAEIQMLSIVGMCGSGKTTLARKLYNHQSVKGHFDYKAWLPISQERGAQRILLELWRDARGGTMEKDETWSHRELVRKLRQYLEGKRYLIVLDDVRTKEALEEIFPALPNDGRRTIITTRNREVIDFPNLKFSIHEPRRLTEEESWDLFRKVTLIYEQNNYDSMDISVLETLGREMLKKCEGLPLAVNALSRILRNMKTLEEWKRVKKAISLRIMEEGRGTNSYGLVNDMLTLSYYDLCRDLKPCFLYLAMFKEDAEIPTGQLIRMWIAKGFIKSNMVQEVDTVEDVARDQLKELIDRCVVQCASKNYSGKVKSIRVHNLLRDLCIKKAKQQDFLNIFTSQYSNFTTMTELRRTTHYSNKTYLPLPTQSPHLRSLLYHGIYTVSEHLELNLQNFRLLRVLFLDEIGTLCGTLPSEIGSLIHLRYLALWRTNIIRLPDSIGNLSKLQYLEWRDIKWKGYC